MKRLLVVFALFFVVGGAAFWYKEIYLSPGRILYLAFQNSQNLSSFGYEGKFAVSAIDENTPDTVTELPMLFQGQVDGALDISQKSNAKGNLNATINTNNDNSPRFEAFMLGPKTYLKIGDFGKLAGLETTSFENQWILFGENFDNREIQLGKILEHPPIRITGRLPLERIDDQVMWHYSYGVNKDNLEILLNPDDENYLDDIDFLPGEIWIGKKDLLIHKIKGFIVQQIGLTTYAFELEINLRDFNTPITLEEPMAAKPATEVLSEILKIAPEDALSINENGNSFLQLFDFQNQTSQARDAKRRDDLLTISKAVYDYTTRNKLPSDFPTKPTCIGTEPVCFNLSSIIGDELPVDPQGGTKENSLYLIYINSAGRVVTSGKGESTPTIIIER